MSEEESSKIDLTEDYNMSKDVIQKLSHLIARGFVDLDWIIEEAKKDLNRLQENSRKRR
jgi:hypothetical protein